jgi:hypothetical protein
MAKGKGFDDWAATAPGMGCAACQSPVRETLVEMLEAIIRNKRQGAFGRKAIFEKLKNVHPEAKIGPRTLEGHLYYHMGDLWAKARGRA